MSPHAEVAVPVAASPARARSVMHWTAFATAYLADPEVTELVVNRPGEVWIEAGGAWRREEVPSVDLDHLLSLGIAVARYCGDDVSDTRPILSAVLPGGERIQMVRPPACEPGTVSVTVRKPTDRQFTLEELADGGLFDYIAPQGPPLAEEERARLGAHERELVALLEAGEYVAFLRLAVRSAQTIVMAGRTSSGKTTLMKTLARAIDLRERLVTIEDTPELTLPHPNRVHLFYSSEDRDAAGATVTPTTLLRSCYRMRPDRILLAEIRGGEAAEFLAAASSGHAGSITSVHAGSCALALDRMAQMIGQTRMGAGTPRATIERDLAAVVDVVVHMDNDTATGRGRHVTEIRYDPAGRLGRAA